MKLGLLIIAAMFGLSCSAVHAAALEPSVQGLLEEDPTFSYFVAISVRNGTGFAEARELRLKAYTVFDFAGIVFTRAPASDVLSWSVRTEVRSIDVIDETAADTFFQVLTHLQTIARYDDLGVLRPNVVNISMGPVRALVGKDASGESAIRAALHEIVDVRRIPVVMSVGNDGPTTGTVNPWAMGTNVIVVGASDASGATLFDRSSRFGAPAPVRPSLFVAEGIDTLGPRAGCRPKTKADDAEDRRGSLTARVGAGNEACWEIKSGTSFSAAMVTRMMCLVHQSLSALRLMGDPASVSDRAIALPTFVRAYIDFDFDRSLKVFENRLVDTRRHYGPAMVTFAPAARQAYIDLVMRTSIDLRLAYEPETALRLLEAFAKPVAGHGSEDVGRGFLSYANVANALRQMRFNDLISILGPDDPRQAKWLDVAKAANDQLVFDDRVIEPIVSYCENNDLILDLPLHDDISRPPPLIIRRQ